ncbi:MAG: SMP-30/gluconolactonase/LRE family protein [Bacteroidales bacterium]
MNKLFYLIPLAALTWLGCNNNGKTGDESDTTNTVKVAPPDVPVQTSVEIMAPEALQLVDTSMKVEELAKGFTWSEGPLWVEELNALVFSDVPENKIYKWSESDGLSVFLQPSGFTDTTSTLKGDGSNGLMLDSEGDLVLCQHGDRRVAILKGGLQNPKAEFITLADNFGGKKFNSPNDLAIKSNGEIYFTDPPYGIKDEKQEELKFYGVYKINQNGEVMLLTDTITRPNGIAFSPDEKTIYIGNSDSDKLYWYTYNVDSKGVFTKGKIFFDATPFAQNGPGAPDGLKVHKNGTVFGTGPSGVFMISPKGKLLGIIHTSKSTANCAFDKDYKYLYLTTTDRLLRVQLK